MMGLAEAAGAMQGRLRGADARFTAVSTDSRTIGAGELFVAIRGERFDGHGFLEAARSRGANSVDSRQIARWCRRSGRSPWIVACLTCMSTHRPQPLSCEARISTRWRMPASIELPCRAVLKATNFLKYSDDCSA